MVLLIDNYDSFTYNLYQCIESLGYSCKVVRNDAMSLEEIVAMNPSHIVISPGPGHPSNGTGISLEIIEKLASRYPILGVCLGHQSIAHVLGGKVVQAPRAKHGKLSKINHDGKGVFAGLPNPLSVVRYHSLIVEPESIANLPLEISAKTDDGIVMAMRHRDFPMEGVQFHPESIATEEGVKMIANFLKRTRTAA